jgi:hypothetical protein
MESPVKDVPSHLTNLYNNVKQWLNSLSCNHPSDERLIGLLNDAYKSGDQLYGESEALEWADGFTFPSHIRESHARMFRECGHSIVNMIGQLKASIATSRLSEDSINKVVSLSNPDYHRMIKLVDGMPLLLSSEFKSSIQASPSNVLSPSYRKLSTAVNKMLFEDFVENRLAFILPWDEVKKHVDNFHLSRLSWTSKVGKKKGRPILDCSAGKNPLNSEETKLSCDAMWGEIQHPSIQTLVQMILNFVLDKNVSLEEVILWKVDLKGAYTLLSFKDSEIPLLGAFTSEQSVIFFLCGVFGWTGTPASFQVVTRVIKSEVNLLIKGIIDMYVDDILGVSLANDVDEDINITCRFCRTLFNSDCIAEAKTEKGRSIDVIGYNINLDSGHVSLTTKNQHRVIYGLCDLQVGMTISVKTIEKFASWISRYASIIPNLKPFIRPIYASIRGRNTLSSFILNDEVGRVLQIFRAIFISAMLDETLYTRHMNSFMPGIAQVVIEFDASLSGGGILFFNGVDGQYLGSSTVNLNSLGFMEESKYQNYAEFIVAVIGVIGAIHLIPNLKHVAFRGDSISALTWLKSGRVKSDIANNVSTIFINLCIKYHLEVTSVSHIPGVENRSADLLSRQGNIRDIRVIDPRVTSNTKIIIPSAIFLSLLKTPHTSSSDKEFIIFWNAIPKIIDHMIKSSYQMEDEL